MQTVYSEGDILHFQKRREAVRRDSYVVLYDARIGAGVFVYLYLRPESYSLVWRGTQDGQFDTTLPFEFFDTQFLKKAPSRVKDVRRSMEKYGSSMLHMRYKFKRHRVTLSVAGEARLREYDLAGEPDKYMAEVVDSGDVHANITFARFDADIEYQGNRKELKGHRVSYSLTFERVGDSSSDVWEFAISIPRDQKLELEEATLKWIARHHGTKEMLRMNFKTSLTELTKMIKPQTEQLYV
jgi:hypothetical protein